MSEGFERWVALMDTHEGIETLLALIALCTVRLIAATLVLPATESKRLTGPVRAVLPTVLALFVAWGQPVDALADVGAALLAVLMLKEALIGFLIGFASATIFWVAEGVGSMIDNLAGYNNVQQSNPQSSDQSTPVGNLLVELAIFSFYTLGGLLGFVGILFESYAWWPLAKALPSGAELLERFAMAQVAGYMSAVAQLAGPVLLVLTLIDLAFGLLTKSAEKLEPGGMAQPVKGATTMVLLSMLIATFFHQFHDELSLRRIGQQLKAFAAAVR